MMATSRSIVCFDATLARPADAGREESLAKKLEEVIKAQIQQHLENMELEGKLRLEIQCEQLRKRVDQKQKQERADGAEGREKVAREQMMAQTDTIVTLVCPGPVLHVVAGNAMMEQLRD